MEKNKTILILAIIRPEAEHYSNMLLRMKYRFGTPAWFLTSWADQELQPQSQGPVVIYTRPLEAWWLDEVKISQSKNGEGRNSGTTSREIFPYASG